MALYFRCDAGSRTGLGHLVRSLALAQMLQPGYAAHFLIQQPEAAIAGQLLAAGFAFTALPETRDYLREANDIQARILADGDMVVLDGYGFDTGYQQALRQKDILLVCLDDLQAWPFAADLIINQAGGVNPALYRALPHTRLCLGPDYALLRAPFLQAAQQERVLPGIDRLLLNMGGADPHNDTCRLLRELATLAPQLHVEVVTGSAYRYGDTLSALAAGQPRIRLHQNLSAEAMCRLMQSCQAAILPPSSVSYEWCCVGGPLFLFRTADNQAAMHAFLLQQQLAEDWANFGAFLLDPEVRNRIDRQLQQQRKYFQGQSPKHLRSAFNRLYFDRFLELRPAQPQDMMRLFEWANDPVVRENSFNQSPIPLEVHRIWFENKIQEKTCLFLVAWVQGIPAGMIRYDLKQNQGVISFLVAPDFRGKGLGTILLQKGEVLLRQLHPEVCLVIGHVQETNQASLSSFRKAQYLPSQTIPAYQPGTVVFEKPLRPGLPFPGRDHD